MEQQELNEGEAFAAVQQLFNAFQAFGKINAVLSHYERVKSELPDLEQRKADLEQSVETWENALAQAKELHERSMQEIEAEAAERKERCVKEYREKVTALTDGIQEIEAQKARVEKEAAEAEAAARIKVEAAEAKVEAAEEAAEHEIRMITEEVAEEQAKLDELKASFEAFKSSIVGQP